MGFEPDVRRILGYLTEDSMIFPPDIYVSSDVSSPPPDTHVQRYISEIRPPSR